MTSNKVLDYKTETSGRAKNGKSSVDSWREREVIYPKLDPVAPDLMCAILLIKHL